MKLLITTDYEIRRDVPVSGRASTQVDRQPVHVGTILNEAIFKATGGSMIHHETVFLEDKVHDWSWHAGQFRFYTKVAEGQADVVIAYATETVEAIPEVLAILAQWRASRTLPGPPTP